MKISAIVTLKKEVLDPQGRIIQQTLNNININSINSIRQGKYFEMDINEKNESKAEEKAKEICKKLLSNEVIEDFKIIKF